MRECPCCGEMKEKFFLIISGDPEVCDDCASEFEIGEYEASLDISGD